MAIHQAFRGHGLFTEYSINNALGRFARYGGGTPATKPADKIIRFVQAIKDMDVQNVWIQIFTRGSRFDMTGPAATLRRDLIAALGSAGIQWAGWGYCAGANAQRDLKWIKDFKNDLGMEAFVIDAEPEEAKQKDIWTETEFDTFVSSVNKLFGIDNTALSTWPCVQVRESSVKKLMKIAEPYICLFAPQVYWMDHPSNTHYQTLGYSMADYPPHDPVAFVRMMMRAWKDAGFTKPLVISGQSYWEAHTPKKSVMGFKANQFAMHFADWDKIIGFNWYHAGKPDDSDIEGSMSDQMISFIKAAKLGHKTYKA
jgi:hypothetical protein